MLRWMATPQMVDEKFAKAGGSVWNHVIIGYSKCNSFETSWRSGSANAAASTKGPSRGAMPPA